MSSLFPDAEYVTRMFSLPCIDPESEPEDSLTVYIDPGQDKWGFSKGHRDGVEVKTEDLPKYYKIGEKLLKSIMSGDETYIFDSVSNFPPILFYIAINIRTKDSDLYNEGIRVLIKLLGYYIEPLKKEPVQDEDIETMAFNKWFSYVEENFSENTYCSDINFDEVRSYMLEKISDGTRPVNWREVRTSLKCSIGWARRIFRCIKKDGRWDGVAEKKIELMKRELALNRLYKVIRTESNNLEFLLNSVFGMRRSSISFNIPKTVPGLYKRLLKAHFDDYGVLNNEKVLDQVREKYLAIRELVKEDVLSQYADRMGDVLSKFSKSCPTSRINELLELLGIKLFHVTSFVPRDLAPEMYFKHDCYFSIDYFFKKGRFYSFSQKWRSDAWGALGDSVVESYYNDLLLPIKYRLIEEERCSKDNGFFDIDKVLEGTEITIFNVMKYLQYYYIHNVWYWYNCKQLGL